LPELGGVNPSAAAIEVLAQPVIARASIVDLSKLGQLLSASAMLQPQAGSQAAAAVDAVGEQGASANLDDGFGKLLAAAQLFVDAFNQFQTSDVNSVQDPLVAPFENVLLLAINGLPGTDGGTSLLASLEQVGIGFQDAAGSVGSTQLAVDSTALQSAFNANPAGTSALLAQAFQTIGVLAVQLAGQNVDLFVTGADVALPASPFDVLPPTLPPIPGDAAVPGALAAQAAVAANLGPAPALQASAPAVNPLQAPLAAVVPQALQISPAAQADDLAANAALSFSAALALSSSPSPTAIALNAQAVANSAFPASASASPFDVLPNVLPNVVPDLTPTALPVASLNAADAALQSSLADQALRNALDANPVPAAPAVETVAPADAPSIAAQAGAELSAPDQVGNPIALPVASAATANAAVVAQVPVQQAPGPAVPAPLAALDDGRAPLALDPSVAAAVAAYRLGDGTTGLAANRPAASLSEPDTEIGAIDRIRPVELDPQDGSGDARRNEKARNAALALEESKALAATRLPSENTVDITV
jgi:hypothetical protein